MENEELTSQNAEKAEEAVVTAEKTEETEAVSDVETAVGKEAADESAQQEEAAQTASEENKAEEGSEAATEHTAAESVKHEEPKKPVPEQKPVKAKKVKADKPKRPAKKATGMSKMFKLVYYPVLAFVALVMIVFSIVDGVSGYAPKAYGDGYYTKVNAHITALAASSRSAMTSTGVQSAREYIVDTLDAGGFVLAEEKKNDDDDAFQDGDKVVTVTEFGTSSGIIAPTVTVMTAVPTGELQTSMGAPAVYVGAEVTNIIAAIPSVKTVAGASSDAVIITVRYDTRTDTDGAADNAAFVANAMQSLMDYVAAGTKFENDIVVVFTESLGYSYGEYAFFDAFDGLNDVVSRAKAGISLDGYGSAGTLALTDVSGAGLDYINAYTKVSGTAFNSSLLLDNLPKELVNTSAVGAFKYAGIPAVQVAVVGGLDAAQSAYDTSANISQPIVKQQADFFKSYVDAFGKTTKSFDAAENKTFTIFSYFDWGTVAYDNIASYVIAALTVLLIAGTIVALALQKTFSIKKMFAALGVELLVVASSIAALYAVYFLTTLMLTGFGVLPIHAITQIRYFNAGIFIAAMLVSIASAFGFTTVYKKLFKVTSSDIVRGTAMLFGIAGVIMGFAVPAFSYVTSWLGMLSIGVLLATTLLNGKLKARFGVGFDRLFVYTVPVIICAPLVFAAMSALTVVVPLYMLPVTMSLFVGMLGVAVPYLDRTQPMLDKVAKKLPARTMRVERVVTERVEDRAKKGKFTERTVKRVEKEKVPINYKNYFGISVVVVIGVAIALLSGGFGVSYGKTLTDAYSYEDAVYNNAFVYEWNYSSTGSVSETLVVDDLMAYKYIRYAVTDLIWDAENSRYVKTVNYPTIVGDRQPNITRNDDGNGYVYTVQTFDGPRSTVRVTIPSATSITKITVFDEFSDEIKYEYSFFRCDTITLALPYGFGDFRMKFEGGDPARFEYREEQKNITVDARNYQLEIVDEWNAIANQYRNTDIENMLRGGIVLKRTVTF
ncbi:MAG: M28 family peptidase [Clostridiales bacterium]|nr:M28 family peptidase [Clostridiales bacterium]